MLEKFIAIDHVIEFFEAYEMISFAVDFTRAYRPRRMGYAYRNHGGALFKQRFNQAGFTGARRR